MSSAVSVYVSSPFLGVTPQIYPETRRAGKGLRGDKLPVLFWILYRKTSGKGCKNENLLSFMKHFSAPDFNNLGPFESKITSSFTPFWTVFLDPYSWQHRKLLMAMITFKEVYPHFWEEKRAQVYQINPVKNYKVMTLNLFCPLSPLCEIFIFI